MSWHRSACRLVAANSGSLLAQGLEEEGELSLICYLSSQLGW